MALEMNVQFEPGGEIRFVSQLHCHSYRLSKDVKRAYNFTYRTDAVVNEVARRLFDDGAHRVFFTGSNLRGSLADARKRRITKKSIGWRNNR